MRKVSIRELRANLAKELNDLPFAIVKRGKVIARCTQDNLNVVECVHKDTIPETFKKLEKAVKSGPVRSLTGWSGGFSKEQQTGKGGK